MQIEFGQWLLIERAAPQPQSVSVAKEDFVSLGYL